MLGSAEGVTTLRYAMDAAPTGNLEAAVAAGRTKMQCFL